MKNFDSIFEENFFDFNRVQHNSGSWGCKNGGLKPNS